MGQRDVQTIIQAEQALAKAHIAMDIATIDSLLHEDYIIVQPGGRLETKEEVIHSYQSGFRHWDQAEVEALEVKIYGNMARVIGLWKAAGTNNGMPFDYQAHFISIWIHDQGSWKNISYASSDIVTE